MIRTVNDAASAAYDDYLALHDSRWSYAAPANGIANTTTAVTIKTAAGAGLRNIITGMQISSGPLGAATEVVIRDGAGGTVLWRGWKPATAAVISINFQTPLRGSADTLLEVATLTATVTGGVYVNVQGYVHEH